MSSTQHNNGDRGCCAVAVEGNTYVWRLWGFTGESLILFTNKNKQTTIIPLQNRTWLSYYKTEHGYSITKQNMVIILQNRTWLSYYKTEHGYHITKQNMVIILQNIPVFIFYFLSPWNIILCVIFPQITIHTFVLIVTYLSFLLCLAQYKKIRKKYKSMQDSLVQPWFTILLSLM